MTSTQHEGRSAFQSMRTEAPEPMGSLRHPKETRPCTYRPQGSLPKSFGEAWAITGRVPSPQVAPNAVAKAELSLMPPGLVVDAAAGRQPPRTPSEPLVETGAIAFKYTPCSLEVCVGQMVELWPPVSLLQQGCRFSVVPRLPLGVKLSWRFGLVYGRPEEPTLGPLTYLVTAWHPTGTPTASVALIQLTVR